MGRIVPWICWQEWYAVRDWLLSQCRQDVARGVQRVEAWRARGRVPLGVDITASLLETALCDGSFWAAPAATSAAAAAAGGGGAGAAQHTTAQQQAACRSLSHQQLRLQYAATIVRMVNGIADSQQRGRVALSVNSLAEAAGLSRLLVDVRHEATHNELPSLATLQLAARQALDWLLLQYWQRQSDHISACHLRVQEVLTAVLTSCEAAAAAGRRGNAAAAAAAVAAAAAGGSDADEALDDDSGVAPAEGASYKAAEGRKQRKNHMAELKGLLPPSHTPLLVCLLLEQDMFFASGQRAAGDSQQQGLTGAGAGFSDAAQQAAFTCLQKQYTALTPQLLEEVISRLCAAAAASQQLQQQQPQNSGLHGGPDSLVLPSNGAAGGAAVPCVADATSTTAAVPATLLQWLRLLLPSAAAARAVGTDAATAAAGAAGSNSVSSGRSSSKKGPAGKRSFGLTPAADMKLQQQQQQETQQIQQQGAQQQAVATALQLKVVQQLDHQMLSRLLRSVLQAVRTCTAATNATPAADVAVSAEQPRAATAAGGGAGLLLLALQATQGLLLSALAAKSALSRRSSSTSRMQQLCRMTALPPLQQQQDEQQQQQQPVDGREWLQSQRSLLDAAAGSLQQLLHNEAGQGTQAALGQQQHQQQSHARKRQRMHDEKLQQQQQQQQQQEADADAGAPDAAVGAGAQGPNSHVTNSGSGNSQSTGSRKKWRRADSWQACAVGCLPGPRGPAVLLEVLQAPGLASQPRHNGVPAASGTEAAAAAAATGAAGRSDVGSDAWVLTEAAGGAAGLETVWCDGAELAPAAVTAVEAGGTRGGGGGAAAAGDNDDQQDSGGADGDSKEQAGAIRLGRWWQVNPSELPQMQQAVQLLL